MDFQCLVAPGPAFTPGATRPAHKPLFPYAVRRSDPFKRRKLNDLEPSWRRRAAGDNPEGPDLASQFSRHINESEGRLPPRTPSPFMAPTAVVAAQMNALQMNDWPDTDAGARTAFAFTKPHDVESPTRAPAGRNLARSWHGQEDWLPFPEFSNMLHSPPLQCLLNCEQWQAVSPLTFTSGVSESRAVQAVEVNAASPAQPHASFLQQSGLQPQAVPQGMQPFPSKVSNQRSFTYTFCLERINTGPYKGCWLTVGVRVGNYAS